MIPSNRYFKCIETGEEFRLYTDPDRGTFELFRGADALEPAYIVHNLSLTLKLSSGRRIELLPFTFYRYKEGEHATHIRYEGYKRFERVN